MQKESPSFRAGRMSRHTQRQCTAARVLARRLTEAEAEWRARKQAAKEAGEKIVAEAGAQNNSPGCIAEAYRLPEGSAESFPESGQGREESRRNSV